MAGEGWVKPPPPDERRPGWCGRGVGGEAPEGLAGSATDVFPVTLAAGKVVEGVEAGVPTAETSLLLCAKPPLPPPTGAGSDTAA